MAILKRPIVWSSGRPVVVLLAALTVLAAADAAPVGLKPAQAVVQASEVPVGVRLKDLCEIDGVRDNQLNGIGLVVGLSGTGDKNPATVRILRQMLSRKNLALGDADLNSSNVALVALTADLPAFARAGTRLHTQVSCIGDATSLKGGILLQTSMEAADGRIYAVGQGPVSIGGFGSAAPAVNGPVGTDHKAIETVAIIESLVEREVPAKLLLGDRIRLVLREADFGTAARVARAVGDKFGIERVAAEDARAVVLRFPDAQPSDNDLVEAVAELQELRVEPDRIARVVINSRTGTVVVGNDVRIAPVAVSHGALSLRIAPAIEKRTDPNDPKQVVEVPVFVDPLTKARTTQPPGGVRPPPVPGTLGVIEGATVEEVANALNALGARPRDLVSIFEAIQRAGALHAQLQVM